MDHGFVFKQADDVLLDGFAMCFLCRSVAEIRAVIKSRAVVENRAVAKSRALVKIRVVAKKPATYLAASAPMVCNCCQE